MIRLFGLSVWIHFVFILVLGLLLHVYLLGDMLREPFQSGSAAQGSGSGSNSLYLGSSYQGGVTECTPVTLRYPFTQENCPQLSAQLSTARNDVQTYTANGRTESLIAAKQMLCAVQPYYDSLRCSTYVAPPPVTPPPPPRPLGSGTMVSGTPTITTTIDMTSYIYPNDMLYLGAGADIQGPYTVKSVTPTAITTVLKNVYNTITNAPIVFYAFQGISVSPLTQMDTDNTTITGSISAGQTYIVTDNSTFLPANLATGDLVYMNAPTCNQYDIDNANGTCSFLPCNLYETDNGDGTCTRHICGNTRIFPWSSNTHRTPTADPIQLAVTEAVKAFNNVNAAIIAAAKASAAKAYADWQRDAQILRSSGTWVDNPDTAGIMNIIRNPINDELNKLVIPPIVEPITAAVKSKYPTISDSNIDIIATGVTRAIDSMNNNYLTKLISKRMDLEPIDVVGNVPLIDTTNTKSIFNKAVEFVSSSNINTLIPTETDIDNGDGTCSTPTLYGPCNTGDTDNGDNTCTVTINTVNQNTSTVLFFINVTVNNSTPTTVKYNKYIIKPSIRYNKKANAISFLQKMKEATASANDVQAATAKYNALSITYTKSVATNPTRVYSKNIGPFIVSMPPTTNTIQVQTMSPTDILSSGSYGGPTTLTGTLFKATYGSQRVGCPTRGDYSNGTVCTQTPAGFYTPFNSYPKPCPIGNYCPVGSDNYIICPAGSYCPPPSSTGGSGSMVGGTATPIQCNPGTFGPLQGATSQLDCSPCSIGYYCPTSGLSTQTVCPVGTYCPTPYTRQPSQCPAGTYCPTTGMSQATVCPSGSFCPDGSVNPTVCPVGTYCPSTHMAAPQQCPAGSFCPTAGLTQATVCPAGTYCPTASSSTTLQCTMGNYCPMGSSSNSPCPAGGYCPTPTTFTPCPAGTYSPSTGQTSDATCIACDSARVCTPGSSQQGICTGGFYCTSTSYALCPAGTYCPPGSTSPTQCSTGSYCPIGSSADTPCPAGSYCPTTTTISQCPAGSYCPEGSTAATPCTTGSYCPAGSSANTPCPAGNYCSSVTTSAACPAGTYCPAGSTATTPCTTQGTYCGVQSAAPVPCPAGGFCPSPSVFNQCPIGTASAGTGKTSISTCAGCPAGSYSSVPGNTSCTACSPGSFGCGGNTAGI